MAAAAIEVYTQTRTILLPTHSKPHYTFTLRDLSNVIRGISRVTYNCLTEENMLYKLLVHECIRVFHDRLTTDQDRQRFLEILDATTQA